MQRGLLAPIKDSTAFEHLLQGEVRMLLHQDAVSAVMLQRPEPAVVAWLDQVDPRQVWLP